jgi:hypothetical protein
MKDIWRESLAKDERCGYLKEFRKENRERRERREKEEKRTANKTEKRENN